MVAALCLQVSAFLFSAAAPGWTSLGIHSARPYLVAPQFATAAVARPAIPLRRPWEPPPPLAPPLLGGERRPRGAPSPGGRGPGCARRHWLRDRPNGAAPADSATPGQSPSAAPPRSSQAVRARGGGTFKGLQTHTAIYLRQALPACAGATGPRLNELPPRHSRREARSAAEHWHSRSMSPNVTPSVLLGRGQGQVGRDMRVEVLHEPCRPCGGFGVGP
jgi:hypothetical protein